MGALGGYHFQTSPLQPRKQKKMAAKYISCLEKEGKTGLSMQDIHDTIPLD